MTINQRLEKNPLRWLIGSIISGAVGCFAVISAFSSFFNLSIVPKDSFVMKNDKNIVIMSKDEFKEYEIVKSAYYGETDLSRFKYRNIDDINNFYILGYQIKGRMTKITDESIEITLLFPNNTKTAIELKLDNRGYFTYLRNKYVVDLERIDNMSTNKSAVINISQIIE